MRFQCIPIDPETADRFRRTGVDDGGNPIQHRVVDAPGAPCRQCLRDAEVGEEMLLLSWHLADFLIPKLQRAKARRFDTRGVLISTVGLVLLVLAIIQGPQWGWTSAATSNPL